MFRTPYNLVREKTRVYINAGNPVKDEYMLRVVDGIPDLELTGNSSLYDYIQSHADSVDIHKILERCAMANDYSILNRMPASFMDTTEMPKNLAEAYTMIQDAKNLFDRMPLDVKNAYNNNYLEFIQSLGSEKCNKVVGEYVEKIKNMDVKKEEVKSDES